MIAIVSSMPPSNSRLLNCNMSTASAWRRARRILAVFALFAAPTLAHAQTDSPEPTQPKHRSVQRAVDVVSFLAGGVLALGAHEGGHLLFDAIFEAEPRIEPVHFGPFPFFAIAHRGGLSP